MYGLSLGLNVGGGRAVAASPPPPPTAPTLLTSLLAFWHFDENGLDASGNGRDLTMTEAGYSSGLIGQCLSSGGGSVTTTIPGTSFSAAFWYQPGPDVEDAGNTVLVNLDNDIYVAGRSNNGGLSTIFWVGTAVNFAVSDPAEWVHVAVVFAADGSGILYVNGSEVETADAYEYPSATSMIISAQQDYPGACDLAGLWGRALSPAEILTLYNGGVGYAPVQPPPPRPAVDFYGTPRTGLAPRTVAFFDASTESPTAWAWEKSISGSGVWAQFSTVQNPPPSAFTAGTWDIRLTATNAFGSSTQTKAGYLVITLPPAPVANFSGDRLFGASPLSVSFTDTSTNTPNAWVWERNDGSGWTQFSTARHPTQVFEVGTWSVRLTATNAGGSDTETRTDYVSVPVIPWFAHGVSPRTIADLTNEAANSVDMNVWSGDVRAVVQVGSIEPGTVVSIAFQESTGTGDWTSAGSPVVVSAANTTASNSITRTKRYMRCLVTCSGGVEYSQADIAVLFCGRNTTIPTFAQGLTPRTIAAGVTGTDVTWATSPGVGTGDAIGILQLGNAENETTVTVIFEERNGSGSWAEIATLSVDDVTGNNRVLPVLLPRTMTNVRCRVEVTGSVAQCELSVLYAQDLPS